MTDELDALLESMNPADPATWAVLADWYLERGLTPKPTALPLVDGVRAALRWRSGFVTAATLEFERGAGPALYGLEPLLRSRALRLTTELRVGARVDPQPFANVTMVFGADATNQLSPEPNRLTARQLDAVLASAPPNLATLVVWHSVDATDVAALEPLTRQRPLSATCLVLRANGKVLLETLDRIAERRWQTIALRSQWRERELRGFDALAARHPDVRFELVRTSARRKPNATWRADRSEPGLEAEGAGTMLGGDDARRPNLRWVEDPDQLTVTTAREAYRLTPESPIPPGLISALWDAGVALQRHHGSYALARDTQLTKEGAVFIDGEPLLGPWPVGPGMALEVRVDDPGHPLAPTTRGAGGRVVFFGAPNQRRHQARFTFTA
jgi:hypothetical protein